MADTALLSASAYSLLSSVRTVALIVALAMLISVAAYHFLIRHQNEAVLESVDSSERQADLAALKGNINKVGFTAAIALIFAMVLFRLPSRTPGSDNPLSTVKRVTDSTGVYKEGPSEDLSEQSHDSSTEDDNMPDIYITSIDGDFAVKDIHINSEYKDYEKAVKPSIPFNYGESFSIEKQCNYFKPGHVPKAKNSGHYLSRIVVVIKQNQAASNVHFEEGSICPDNLEDLLDAREDFYKKKCVEDPQSYCSVSSKRSSMNLFQVNVDGHDTFYNCTAAEPRQSFYKLYCTLFFDRKLKGKNHIGSFYLHPDEKNPNKLFLIE